MFDKYLNKLILTFREQLKGIRNHCQFCQIRQRLLVFITIAMELITNLIRKGSNLLLSIKFEKKRKLLTKK